MGREKFGDHGAFRCFLIFVYRGGQFTGARAFNIRQGNCVLSNGPFRGFLRQSKRDLD